MGVGSTTDDVYLKKRIVLVGYIANMTNRFRQIQRSPRRRNKDIQKDLTIANAKNVYLVSNKSFSDLEHLLDNLSLLVPSF